MTTKVPITLAGFAQLQEEIKTLKTVERPAIIQAIAEAREHGDLSENAEYHAAREQQGFIEGRINELEAALSFAEIIDVARLNAAPRIVFGAIIELEDADSGERVTYQIVGDLEADIKAGLLSVSSPFARSLIGKSEGESVDFNAPAGTRCYDIVSVRYA